MNEIPASPSRLLRTVDFAARWAAGLLLTAWLILIALWIILHGLIVPRIEDYRPLLEQHGSRWLGVPFRVGSIRVVTLGMVPSFELNDIELHDAQGQVALHLPKVAVALSPRSVWKLGFEQLYIDQPMLDIRRALDGRIFVAGLDFSRGGGGDSQDLERWFFSQTEFVIHNGQVRWTDEQRSQPPLELTGVNVLVRNSLRRHAFHADATLPQEWGHAFSVNGRFRQPLLSRNTGNWRDWDGQVYTQLDAIDVSRLRQHVDVGIEVLQGKGALRAWTDLRKGEVTGITADLALHEASVRLDAQSEPLTLTGITGRLGGKRLPQGMEFSTRNLQFKLADGRAWPGGNMAVVLKNETTKQEASGELHADHLDLAALGQIAQAVPGAASLAAQLKTQAVRGLIEKVDAKWRGKAPWPAQFEVQGRFADLSFAAGAATVVSSSETDYHAPQPGRPGVSGASGTFEWTPSGGKAQLSIRKGSVNLPGVFEDPELPIDALSTEFTWQIQGDHLAIQTQKLQFSNKDAEGAAQLSWRSSDPARSPSRSRFPGMLDLQGHLSRAEAARVQRYLPLVLAPRLRSYLGTAIQQGSLSAVRFRVKGDLYHLPFSDARQGDFQVSALVKNAQFAYAPAMAGADWPALTQLSGELLFDHHSMQVRGATGKFAGFPGLQLTRGDVQISDLGQAVVVVNAEAKGPAGEALALVSNSPIGRWTQQVLGASSANGGADYKLRLSLPLADLNKSKVQGTVTFSQNDFQLNPGLPTFSKARGSLTFTESGFALQGTAGFLGGDTRIEGGTTRRTGTPVQHSGLEEPQISFRAQGTASALGLQRARQWGPVPIIAQHAQGTATYNAMVSIRNGVPEIAVQSDLVGMAIDLPSPLNKPASSNWPLRYDQTLLQNSPLTDRIGIELEPLGSVVYERDISGSQAKVLRGSIGLGLASGEHAPMPPAGVSANLNLNRLNLDAWNAALRPEPVGQQSVSANGAEDVVITDYLPQTLALRAQELTVDSHPIKNLVAGGSRLGNTWRTNMEANELSGYLEYREASATAPGRVFARLARLSIAPGAATQVETMLSEPPTAIPALDIVVEDMDLRGKKLGRVEVDAINRAPREWRLNKLNIGMPEATFAATGLWMSTEPSQPRRTGMNFKLSINDAGQLLERFGMREVVRKGSGKLEGEVSWQGSPLALDHPSLSGTFNIDIEKGQFLKADPGLAKLLGVLSLQSLPRRLTLDFRDVFSDGFAFDFIRGDAQMDKGIAFTNNLQMKGVNAAVLMEGNANIAKETQDLKVVVVPEINAGTASLVASVINPMVGLTTFLTQIVLRRPLIEANTQEFHIDGSWADPRVTRIERHVPAKEIKP